MDFNGVALAHPAGNELTLADGVVVVSQIGTPVGDYEVVDALLVLRIELPKRDEEPQSIMMIKVPMPEPGEIAAKLPGVVEAELARNLSAQLAGDEGEIYS